MAILMCNMKEDGEQLVGEVGTINLMPLRSPARNGRDELAVTDYLRPINGQLRLARREKTSSNPKEPGWLLTLLTANDETFSYDTWQQKPISSFSADGIRTFIHIYPNPEKTYRWSCTVLEKNANVFLEQAKKDIGEA